MHLGAQLQFYRTLLGVICGNGNRLTDFAALGAGPEGYINFSFPARGNLSGRRQSCRAPSRCFYILDDERTLAFIFKIESVLQ